MTTVRLLEAHLLKTLLLGMCWSTLQPSVGPREWYRCFWCGETMPAHRSGCKVEELVEARARLGQPRTALDVERDIHATVDRLNDLFEEAYHGPDGTDVTILERGLSGNGQRNAGGRFLRLHLRTVIE
jgi:hypothetical protein